MLWASLLVAAACVTVNIYFPAAAAEQAADTIIRDIYGLPGQDQPRERGEPKSETPAPSGDGGPTPGSLLAWLVPAAHAAEPNIDVDSPGIAKLQGAMRKRHRLLEAYYASGAVGMTRSGRLQVRDIKAVPLADRNAVKQWVAEENRDRDALYGEVARENEHPEWEDEVRTIFAQRWIANAPGGWWYETSAGAWKRK
ncbi:MAG: YdbL family protein [Gammaproteobacteria bacterium]